MNALFVSQERFMPQNYAYLLEKGFYNPPLPETFYAKIVKEYEALSDVDVSRIIYESDGLKITGVLATPAQITPAAHPIIIYNRGGNRNFGALSTHSVMQHIVPFARRGYLVFASNYRGNEGSEGVEEFGGKDINDVLNLLAIARNHAGFDKKNAYMIGRSRGGMMTYLAIKHGAALNAAISMAGISDLTAGAKERPEMLKTVYSKLIPGSDDLPQELTERSARHWPEKLTLPLLLLHGDNDIKVDASHSMLLAQDMEKLGLTHKLKIYPGDNHALLRNAEDTVTESCLWMERFAQ